MTTQSARIDHEMEWSYPEPGEQAFVLRAHGERIGLLRFEKQPGARSVAEWDGQRWTFERHGLFHPSVTVRCEGSGEIVAAFTPSPAGGGGVAFSTGKHFGWAREHPWASTWCFRSKEHKSTVCVSQRAGPLTAGAKVTVCPNAATAPETPLLVLLAWYLRVVEFEKLSESIFVCG